MSIVFVMPKLKFPYADLVNEYAKRSNRFAKVVVDVPQGRNFEEYILRKYKDKHLILFDETGKELTTLQFKQTLDNMILNGVDTVFVIGNADGHSDNMKKQADTLISLSKLTLPHGLAAVVAVETVYRALSLRAGHPYHRE